MATTNAPRNVLAGASRQKPPPTTRQAPKAPRRGRSVAPREALRRFMLTVDGEPVGKARARVTARGTYTPEKTRAAQERISWEAKAWWGRQPLMEGPVRLNIIAWFSKPKREKGVRPCKRPDWDNVGKIVSDALNGIVYQDESQVVEAVVEKRYATMNPAPFGFGGVFGPRLAIVVEEL